jgi:hypothetical protein
MTRKHKTYSILKMASAVFFIAALLWLTVSVPFVYKAQQDQAQSSAKEKADNPFAGSEEEAPLGSTEEKAPGTNTLSEEYLHDHHKQEYFFSVTAQYHKCENAGTYHAFHGELLVPPPNVA